VPVEREIEENKARIFVVSYEETRDHDRIRLSFIFNAPFLPKEHAHAGISWHKLDA